MIRGFASGHPKFIEMFYSRGIYPIISRVLTSISNLFSFSVGEMLLVGALFFCILLLINFVMLIVRKKFDRLIRGVSLFLLTILLSLSYFDLIWLMNNYRMDIRDLMDLPEAHIETQDLASLFEKLIQKTNSLREEISVEATVYEVLARANDGYVKLHQRYNFILKDPVFVKGLLSSDIQTTSGYMGIYLFYIGEPAVNKNAPIFTLPHTACHELAHQKGFAEEEAADYISFLACKENESILFQYSGYYTAMKYIGSTLYDQDPSLYYKLSALYSEKVVEDLKIEREFWNQKKNTSVEKIADRINDSYLKSYNQPDGIMSYGKFTDLLIADYLKCNEI